MVTTFFICIYEHFAAFESKQVRGMMFAGHKAEINHPKRLAGFET